MMKKIVLIAPYFGTLPKRSFQLTLDSCRSNDTINWIIFTDDESKYDYPENVKVIYQNWTDFSQFIKSAVHKKIQVEPILDDPYKLTDYKPLYGDLFQKYISDYDFWGYTDISDVIYGNLRKYFLEEDLTRFEKINFLGHLTLFKNNQEINERYKIPTNGERNIADILTKSENFAFDEQGQNSIHEIYRDNKFSFKRLDEMIADISPLRFAFQLSKFDKNYNQYYEPFTQKIFSYENGKLLEWQISPQKIVTSREVGYVHFQKRKLQSMMNSKQSSFLITPYGFIDYQNIDRSFIQKNAPRKIYMPFFKLKWRALLKRIRK